MRTILSILPLLCAVSSAAAAQDDDELQVPAEVRSFVEDGTKAIAVEFHARFRPGSSQKTRSR